MIPNLQQQGGFAMPQMPNMGAGNAFQFPPGMGNQQYPVGMNAPAPPSHRRNQSAVAGVGNMGPPPPPPGK
jgi:protein SSD1